MAKETATPSYSKFVSAVVTKAKGDKVVETAERNERIAKAAIAGQLSALEGKLVEAEIKAQNAENVYNDAVCPVELITDTKSYIAKVAKAKQDVLNTLEEVEEIKASIEEFNTILSEIF